MKDELSKTLHTLCDVNQSNFKGSIVERCENFARDLGSSRNKSQVVISYLKKGIVRSVDYVIKEKITLAEKLDDKLSEF